MTDVDSARRREDNRAQRSSHGHREHRERIGNYVVGQEIGRGSFATVYLGHRSVSFSSVLFQRKSTATQDLIQVLTR